MLVGDGRFRKIKRGSHFQYWIYVSTDLIKDSQFPFEEDDNLTITIDINTNSLLIVKKDDIKTPQKT
ncbi:hypothetical protein ES704_03016 [subsurface metagenome]|jgi:hypothetical protein